MSRFFVPPKNIGDKVIIVEGEEAKHVLDVMRLSEGDDVVVFDGAGNEYLGRISGVSNVPRKAVIDILKKRTSKVSVVPMVTLAQAIPKKGKMDYIVEKATELGVSGIIPLVTERTIVRPDDDGRSRKESRWEKIAIEASKQCGRADVPKVEEFSKFRDLVKSLGRYDLVLFACLSDETIPLKEALHGLSPKSILVVIGPEGCFTKEEIKAVKRSNLKLVSLGERVLKSNTAGLFILSVINYEYSAR